jgi:hypothetical protein
MNSNKNIKELNLNILPDKILPAYLLHDMESHTTKQFLYFKAKKV